MAVYITGTMILYVNKSRLYLLINSNYVNSHTQ